MNIEEAATQAGIDMSLWSMGAGSLAFVEGVHGIPRDEFERFAKIIRNQALEDAAAVCDVTPPKPFRPSIEAAHDIRAMKEQT